jgi:hypothetical protein
MGGNAAFVLARVLDGVQPTMAFVQGLQQAKALFGVPVAPIIPDAQGLNFGLPCLIVPLARFLAGNGRTRVLACYTKGPREGLVDTDAWGLQAMAAWSALPCWGTAAAPPAESTVTATTLADWGGPAVEEGLAKTLLRIQAFRALFSLNVRSGSLLLRGASTGKGEAFMFAETRCTLCATSSSRSPIAGSGKTIPKGVGGHEEDEDAQGQPQVPGQEGEDEDQEEGEGTACLKGASNDRVVACLFPSPLRRPGDALLRWLAPHADGWFVQMLQAWEAMLRSAGDELLHAVVGMGIAADCIAARAWCTDRAQFLRWLRKLFPV